MRVDPDLVVPDDTVTLKRGAIAPWAKSTSPYYGQTLEAIAKHYGVTTTTKWKDLPEKVRNTILHGSGSESIRMAYDDGLRAYEVRKPFEGVVPNLERRFKETESDWAREEISRFMGESPCVACGGKRLKPEALAVKIAGSDIADATALSVRDAGLWFGDLPRSSPRSRTRSRAASSRRSASASPSWSMWASNTSPSPAPPARSRAARASASGSPPDRLRPHGRSLRARRALHRPAPARQRAPARRP
jgi:excinuclease UvrABC ATPase subunit